MNEPTPIGGVGVPICMACEHYFCEDEEYPCVECKHCHIKEYIRSVD